MPEGPSIVILKELVMPFKGKIIESGNGNAKIDMDLMTHKKIIDFKSWGKHFLICFNGFYIRIHLLMFGTYLINERKEGVSPRLSLKFKKGEINFYTCSIKLIEGDVNKDYNWETDIMSDKWNASAVLKKLKEAGHMQVTDALLDQEIFSGSGNIIKNEVLFRVKVHPQSLIECLPLKKIKELVKDVSAYSFEFYKWKKAFVLKKHWLIYSKKTCPRCKIPVHKEYLGKNKRITYFCFNCQELYNCG